MLTNIGSAIVKLGTLLLVNKKGGKKVNLNNFLSHLIKSEMTLNEISILLELGYGSFTRSDLLSNPNRCPENTYTPSALTRTLKKLLNYKQAIVITYNNGNNRVVYSLVGGQINYGNYTNILLNLARSKVLTLNTMKVALQMILNKNKLTTTRYLAKQLNMRPDYLSSSVIPRMILINLMETNVINLMDTDDVNHTTEDASTQNLYSLKLNMNWTENFAGTLI